MADTLGVAPKVPCASDKAPKYKTPRQPFKNGECKPCAVCQIPFAKMWQYALDEDGNRLWCCKGDSAKNRLHRDWRLGRSITDWTYAQQELDREREAAQTAANLTLLVRERRVADTAAVVAPTGVGNDKARIYACQRRRVFNADHMPCAVCGVTTAKSWAFAMDEGCVRRWCCLGYTARTAHSQWRKGKQVQRWTKKEQRLDLALEEQVDGEADAQVGFDTDIEADEDEQEGDEEPQVLDLLCDLQSPQARATLPVGCTDLSWQDTLEHELDERQQQLSPSSASASSLPPNKR